LPKHKKKESKKEPKEIIKTGKFIGNEVGFGFVALEGQEEDIFIPPHFTWGALHGDEVLCRLVKKEEPPPSKKKGRKPSPPPEKNQRQIGEVVEVTRRKPQLGTYYAIGNEGYIQPVEKKISTSFTVPQRSRNRFGLAEGHRVIFLAPKPKRGVGDKPSNIYTAQVTEVLGHIHDPGVDVLTLVRQFGIPHEFPESLLSKVSGQQEVKDEELVGRRDLRGEDIFTIDGDDTKDIDDAISLSKTPEGHWLLGVHIADVSHYVKPGTPLDEEALSRGTSVYLADRVIPMLPHYLSSGICSLFPGVDRLTLSCIMTVDTEGNVISYEITPSIINSKKRWAYHEVQRELDAGNLAEMNQLRETLYQKRRKKGALDFDIPEAKIKVDEEGHPISIELYERTEATNIIEEFMILCNETIATHAIKNDMPLIYRTHETPSQEKLIRLREMAKSLGLDLPPGPMGLQRLLSAAEGSPAYYAVAMAALTSLPQAYYTPDSPKHYGLASDAYCHFTSPIRRYADLMVHRMIKERVCSNHQNPEQESQSLHSIASQCSRTEREAEALEREVAQLKKVQFMKGKEGQAFEGIISGITPWGAYVMLPNTTEGLIPSQQMKRLGYSHDKEKSHYINKRNRAVLGMGASVKVHLVSADSDERRLTFSL